MINKISFNQENEFLLYLKDFNYAIFCEMKAQTKNKYTYSDSKVKIIVTSGAIDITIVENKPFFFKNTFFLKQNEFIDIKENNLFNISNLYEEQSSYIKLVNSNYNLIEFEENDFFNGRMRSFLDGES
jgi:hypothetical protein